MADLDRGDADAAGGAEDGQRLALLQPGALLQRMQRSAIGDEQTGRLLRCEPVRNFDELLDGNRDFLARRAKPARPRNLVADLETGDAGPSALIVPENSPPGENGGGGFTWYLFSIIRVSKKFSPT